MARPRGSKNKVDEDVKAAESNEPEQQEQPKPAAVEQETDKEVSYFEAAEHFKTSEATIKVWIDHGHLEERNGRIPMRSITRCKFNSRRMV